MSLWKASALALALSAPVLAYAEPPIGDVSTMTLSAGTTTLIGGIRPESFTVLAIDVEPERPTSKIEQFAAANVTKVRSKGEQMVKVNGGLPEGALPEVLPVSDDQVRLTFKPVADAKDMILIIQNGHDRAIIFDAVMIGKNKTVPTSICPVGPKQVGLEHWQHPIARLGIMGMRFIEPGAPVPESCAPAPN